MNLPRPFAWVWLDDAPEQGRPLWKSNLGGPCYVHYQDHMYDFLVRTEPARRFVPDLAVLGRYAGTYKHEGIGVMEFRVVGGELLLRLPWQEREIPGIAVDNEHVAYEDFGLVTFHGQADGGVLAMEWWTNLLSLCRSDDLFQFSGLARELLL